MRTSRQFAVSSRSYLPRPHRTATPNDQPEGRLRGRRLTEDGGKSGISPGRAIRSEGRRLRSPTAFVSYASERIFMRHNDMWVAALGHGAGLSDVIGSVDRGHARSCKRSSENNPSTPSGE